jgi:hydrogenase maturation factor
MSDTPFPLGKLPANHLARLLSQVSLRDPRVVVGPQVGEDAAVLDLGDRYLVVKSDPITFATDQIGWYAVHVNANDVACTGAMSRWFLATLLLPAGRADASLVDGIFEQIVGACEEIGATLVGGHTEITHNLDRPILVGTMLGEVGPERLVTTSGARAGDALVLTNRVAVEATAIIAREKRAELEQQYGLSVDFLDRCADFIRHPGISVAQAAQVATEVAPIHAMHDPTEGGLATGLWEVATAARVGLEIHANAVPFYAETRRLCEIYGLDPWGVIGSGSLLLAVAESDAGRVCDALIKAGIEAVVIGRVVPQEKGVMLCVGEQKRPLPTFARDEIARLFE